MMEITSKKPRNSAIELCRIICMIMIVACHFATHGGFSFTNGDISIQRLWWNFIEMGGNFGVDVFVLIAGYFLVDDKGVVINIKKCLILWGQLVFYSILSFVFSLLSNQAQFSIISLIKALMPITFSAWWFASAYFVLFLLHPFLNHLLQKLDRNSYQKLLILILTLWCIIPVYSV